MLYVLSSAVSPHADTLSTVNIILFVIATLIGVLGFLAAVWGARAYLATAKVKAQLEAKDETINTNEQLIKALERRVSTLEVDHNSDQIKLQEMENRLVQVQYELTDSRARYEELKDLSDKYSAPAAVERFERMLLQHAENEQLFAKRMTESLNDIALKSISRYEQIIKLLDVSQPATDSK